MSQKNVELAREAALAWNDGGVDALLQYLDSEVEWHAPLESMEPGIYLGHDGVRDYVGRLGEIFENRRTEPLTAIDVDEDRVILVVRIIARSEHSETDITANWTWLITVGANRKAIRIETFTDKARALEAAGLAGLGGSQET